MWMIGRHQPRLVRACFKRYMTQSTWSDYRETVISVIMPTETPTSFHQSRSSAPLAFIYLAPPVAVPTWLSTAGEQARAVQRPMRRLSREFARYSSVVFPFRLSIVFLVIFSLLPFLQGWTITCTGSLAMACCKKAHMRLRHICYRFKSGIEQ